MVVRQGPAAQNDTIGFKNPVKAVFLDFIKNLNSLPKLTLVVE